MFSVDHLPMLIHGWAHPTFRALAGHGRMAVGHWLASQTGMPREDCLVLVGGLLITAAHHLRHVEALLRGVREV